MKIISAEFLTGAVRPGQYPASQLPEFAFAGRSNVGKSSLIRSLLNRKKLVRTSGTPGKTREINFFRINGELSFADLPGYGFARVSAKLQDQWKIMIEDYLLTRKNLQAVIFIVDARREPTKLDIELKSWLDTEGVRYIIAATKSDKLSQSERRKHSDKIRSVFVNGMATGFVLYSSKDNVGRKELWSEISKLASASKQAKDSPE
jgi:GTP-binding protein